MKKIVVWCDDREKRPIVFPKTVEDFSGRTLSVESEKKRLKAGDYTLRDHNEIVGIERKGSPMELWGCLFGPDRDRFKKQLEKMRKAYDVPMVLVDSSPAELISFDYRRFVTGAALSTGEHLVAKLTCDCLEFGAFLSFVGRVESASKLYSTGQYVVSMLLGGVEHRVKLKEQLSKPLSERLMENGLSSSSDRKE